MKLSFGKMFPVALMLSACGGPVETSTTPLTPATQAPAKKLGAISLNNQEYTVFGMPVESATAIASFAGATPSTTGSTNNCKVSQIEGCSLSQCDLPQNGTNGNTSGNNNNTGTTTTVDGVSAGNIDIAGTLLPISLKFSGGKYETFTRSQKIWKGGETINVSAAGDKVPAFKVTATAPATVTLTAPSVSSSTPLSVTLNKPLEFAWTNGKGGDVIVTLTANTSTQATSLSCKFAASAGKGTIPAAATAKLPAASTTSAYAMQVASTSNVTVGDYSVSLNLYSAAITSSGPVGGQLRIVK